MRRWWNRARSLCTESSDFLLIAFVLHTLLGNRLTWASPSLWNLSSSDRDEEVRHQGIFGCPPYRCRCLKNAHKSSAKLLDSPLEFFFLPGILGTKIWDTRAWNFTVRKTEICLQNIKCRSIFFSFSSWKANRVNLWCHIPVSQLVTPGDCVKIPQTGDQI